MANVSINLTQSAANTAIVLGTTTLSDFVDPLIKFEYLISVNYPYYSTYSIAGTTARFNYADGASQTLYGGVLVSRTINYET